METKKHCFNTMLLAGLLALSAAVGMTACSEDDSMVEDVSYNVVDLHGNHPGIFLQLTRDGNDLHCIFYNYAIGCGTKDIRVDCQYKNNIMNLNFRNIERGNDEDIVNRVWYVNVFFTLRDVKEDLFYVNIPSYNNAYFPVDMRGHRSVKVDFTIGEPIYYYDEEE